MPGPTIAPGIAIMAAMPGVMAPALVPGFVAPTAALGAAAAPGAPAGDGRPPAPRVCVVASGAAVHAPTARSDIAAPHNTLAFARRLQSLSVIVLLHAASPDVCELKTRRRHRQVAHT